MRASDEPKIAGATASKTHTLLNLPEQERGWAFEKFGRGLVVYLDECDAAAQQMIRWRSSFFSNRI